MKNIDVLSAIRNRKTVKVIAEQPLPSPAIQPDLIQMLMESAYWAPFHKPCQTQHRNNFHNLDAIMPWRFYILDATSCRQLAKYLARQDKEIGKILGMLNATDYLIQATWTPDNPIADNPPNNLLFEGNEQNMEHIAAASAAIQNLLLSATANNISNYWSSGGILRDRFVLDLLNIPNTEILLGALFLFPNTTADTTRLDSKLRDKRGSVSQSFQIIDFSIDT